MRERAAPAEIAITAATTVIGSAVTGAVGAVVVVPAAGAAGAAGAGAAAAPLVAEVALRRIPLEPHASLRALLNSALTKIKTEEQKDIRFHVL